ncbi:hypothetical protein D3C81_1905910 [compost metagenome]
MRTDEHPAGALVTQFTFRTVITESAHFYVELGELNKLRDVVHLIGEVCIQELDQVIPVGETQVFELHCLIS